MKSTSAAGSEKGEFHAIGSYWLQSLMRLQTDYIDIYQIHWPDRYVPMFGETEYDPSKQFTSVPMEEQLDALGKAVDADKICWTQ